MLGGMGRGRPGPRLPSSSEEDELSAISKIDKVRVAQRFSKTTLLVRRKMCRLLCFKRYGMFRGGAADNKQTGVLHSLASTLLLQSQLVVHQPPAVRALLCRHDMVAAAGMAVAGKNLTSE